MIPLYLLAAAGLFLVPRFVAALAVLLLGYQTLVAMLFVGETRYRAPWDFLLALLAGATVAELLRRRSQIRLLRGREGISGDVSA
jgi:hypothetical protein